MKFWAQKGRGCCREGHTRLKACPGPERMAAPRGVLCARMQASVGVGRVLGTLPDMICQVELTLGAPRKNGWAPGRGGTPAKGIEPLLQPSRGGGRAWSLRWRAVE